MDIILIVLKIITIGTLDYYLSKIFDRRANKGVLGIISPFYILFGILSSVLEGESILFVFIAGIIWGYFLNLYFKTSLPKMYGDINIIYIGLLNIFNVFILNQFLDNLLFNLNPNFLIILFTLSLFLVLMDISLTMRKNI